MFIAWTTRELDFMEEKQIICARRMLAWDTLGSYPFTSSLPQESLGQQLVVLSSFICSRNKKL